MRQQTLIILMTLLSFLAFSQVVEAKRFGFGGSHGYSKKMAPKNYGTRTASKPKAAQASPSGKATAATGGRATSGASRWLGPLAGLAAGGLLAAMFMGDGFDGLQMFDFIIIGVIGLMAFAFFRRKRANSPKPQYAGQSLEDDEGWEDVLEAPQQRQSQQENTASHRSQSGSMIGSALSEEAHHVSEKPAWFDEAGFIANATSHFIAVQKAWDEVNLADIKSYCTDELYEALKAEMSQMKPGENHTEVDEVKAEIADMAIDGQYFMVSVRFSGFIKEEKDGFAHAFHEIWHIKRDASDTGNWLIAGIQQLED